MQVNSKQIKRPKLIEPFFNEELLPDNSFVTYIEVSPKATKNIKNSTPSKNISKKHFKTYKTKSQAQSSEGYIKYLER